MASSPVRDALEMALLGFPSSLTNQDSRPNWGNDESDEPSMSLVVRKGPGRGDDELSMSGW
jgi:hypothetical protein